MARAAWIVLVGSLVACSGDKESVDLGDSLYGPQPDGGKVETGDGGDLTAHGDGDLAGAPGKNIGESAYFPAGSWFLNDVYDVAKSPHSDTMIAALESAGGWGNGNVFQMDFSIDVLNADANAPLREFTERTKDNGFAEDEFYAPDCDHVPIPIPPNGNVEGYPDYHCAKGGDCHLIVFSASTHKLYEAWRADIDGDTFVSGCLAVWDTSKAVSNAGRGLQCTSADAAGFSIAALLFTADEVKAGEIKHAIRFTLPNDRPRDGFVAPATHGTHTSGPDGAPSYGMHLRLRRDYPLAGLSKGAQVVARALQHYGMFHADGGEIALTGQIDTHSTAKWDGLLDQHDLSALKVGDFEVIDHGAAMPLTYDCMR